MIPGHTSYSRQELNELSYRYNTSNDRVYDDILTLPNSPESLYLPVNEVLTSTLVNNLVDKLYENYMYILSRCKIAKTDAFESYRGFFEITTDSYTTPVTGLYSTEKINKVTDNILTEDVKSVSLIETTQSGVYGYIIATSTTISMYRFIPNYAKEQNGVLVSVSQGNHEQFVESNNQLEFSDILKCFPGPTDVAYVYDSGRHVLYKYNIKGLTRQDAVILQQETTGRQLLEIVGGVGTAKTSTRFGDVVDIIYSSTDKHIYVLDSTDSQYTIKVYDNQLNWTATHDISLDFRRAAPIKIKQHQNNIHILTTNGDLYTYSVDDLNAGLHNASRVDNLSVIDFDFVVDEHYKDILFSDTTANLCYVVTNKSIYKKYVSRLDRITGNISWVKHNIVGGTFSPDIVTMINRTNTLQDIMLVIGSCSDDEYRMLHFIDAENIQEMVSRSYEEQVFLLDEIKLHPNETVSSFTYNKLLFKLLYNNSVILNNIKYVATVEIDYNADFIYPGIKYISQQEINTINSTRDSNIYVGINELVTTGVFNRVIDSVIDDQQKVLNCIFDRKNTQEFFNSSSLRLVKSPVPHVIYRLIKPDADQTLGGTHKIIKI